MEWILNILIAIDQLGNAIAGGNPSAVISARVGYFSNIRKTLFQRFWKALEWTIDFTFHPIDGPNHCLQSLQNDKDNKYKQGNDFAKALLGVIIIFTCPILAILLRFVILIKPSWHYELNTTSQTKKSEIDEYS